MHVYILMNARISMYDTGGIQDSVSRADVYLLIRLRIVSLMYKHRVYVSSHRARGDKHLQANPSPALTNYWRTQTTTTHHPIAIGQSGNCTVFNLPFYPLPSRYYDDPINESTETPRSARQYLPRGLREVFAKAIMIL